MFEQIINIIQKYDFVHKLGYFNFDNASLNNKYGWLILS